MSIEVDINDIPIGSSYGDERCKRLERILLQDSEFTKYKVKRYRTKDNPIQDPFFVMTEDEEENMMWLNEWEVDALDDSEMLSYITVTIRTSRKPDPVENWMLISALFAALFLSSLLIYFIIPEFQTYSFYPMMILISFLLMVVFGLITYSKSKSSSRQTKEMDIEIMQQHPLFLQAIQRFAALTNVSDSKRVEYEKRLEEIESMLQDG